RQRHVRSYLRSNPWHRKSAKFKTHPQRQVKTRLKSSAAHASFRCRSRQTSVRSERERRLRPKAQKAAHDDLGAPCRKAAICSHLRQNAGTSTREPPTTQHPPAAENESDPPAAETGCRHTRAAVGCVVAR